MNKNNEIFKKGIIEAYKNWIEFCINAGEEKEEVRRRFLEKVNSNLNIYNDKAHVFYKNEKILIEAIEIMNLINQLVPVEEKIEGIGTLKGNNVKYEFTNIYSYTIFKDNIYKLKKELSNNINHKLNGSISGKFAIDPYKNIYLSKQ